MFNTGLLAPFIRLWPERSLKSYIREDKRKQRDLARGRFERYIVEDYLWLLGAIKQQRSKGFYR